VSRSLIIAMLYLTVIGYFQHNDFYTAEGIFFNLYPNYNLGIEMGIFAIEYFDSYKIYD